MILSATVAENRHISQKSRSGTGSKSAMKFKIFDFLVFGLAASGLIVSSQAAYGSNVKQQINAQEAQHLVCVKQDRHLLCDVEKSSNAASESRLRYDEAAPDQEAVDAETEVMQPRTVSDARQMLTSEQQETISNMLLEFMFFVLPVGIVLGVLFYDKYCNYRTAVLHKQTEILEKLWRGSSQP